MNIEITRAKRHDTPVLQHLYELYSYDFSVYTQADIANTGLYTDESFLSGYWNDMNWSSFLVRVDGSLAGFAWMLRTTLIRPQDIWTLKEGKETRFLQEIGFLKDEPHNLIEEFFIMRKYRLRGAGETVARMLFDQYPGIWEVSEMVENTPAQAFWRKVIGRYTGERYIELTLDTELWHGPVQVFMSSTQEHGPRSVSG